MINDWRSVVNNFTEPGGMSFIGCSLTENMNLSHTWLKSYKIVKSYIQAWILNLIPILLFLYIYNFHKVSTCVIGKILTWCSYFCALVPVIILTTLINDFGRIISYSSLIFIIYAIFIISINKNSTSYIKPQNCINIFTFDRIFIFALTLYYIFFWTLYHNVPPTSYIFSAYF